MHIGQQAKRSRTGKSPRARFDRLAAAPYYAAVLEALRAYVEAAVPDPIATERERWSLSCLPSTSSQRLSAFRGDPPAVAGLEARSVMAETVRYALLVRTCLEVLRDRGGEMPGRAVLDEIARRIDLTDVERKLHQSGDPAWLVAARYIAGDAATVGWMVKRNNLWWITDAGREALDAYPRTKYESQLETIVSAIELVPAGFWTAFDDVAELVGGSADEIAHR